MGRRGPGSSRDSEQLAAGAATQWLWSLWAASAIFLHPQVDKNSSGDGQEPLLILSTHGQAEIVVELGKGFEMLASFGGGGSEKVVGLGKGPTIAILVMSGFGLCSGVSILSPGKTVVNR